MSHGRRCFSDLNKQGFFCIGTYSFAIIARLSTSSQRCSSEISTSMTFDRISESRYSSRDNLAQSPTIFHENGRTNPDRAGALHDFSNRRNRLRNHGR